jgi:hypothetical protein
MAFTILSRKKPDAKRWKQERVSGLRLGRVLEVIRRAFKRAAEPSPLPLHVPLP